MMTLGVEFAKQNEHQEKKFWTSFFQQPLKVTSPAGFLLAQKKANYRVSKNAKREHFLLATAKGTASQHKIISMWRQDQQVLYKGASKEVYSFYWAISTGYLSVLRVLSCLGTESRQGRLSASKPHA